MPTPHGRAAARARSRARVARAPCSPRPPAARGGSRWSRGPPGIGKSRLLAELRARRPRRTAPGARRARQRARARVPVRRRAPAVRAGAERPRGARALARGRRRRRPSASSARPIPRRRPARPTPRSPPCTASTGSTANLAAEGPLLLAVDDLHWCDRPSLRFLAYLARRLEGMPVLVGATPAQHRAGHRPGAARRDRRTTRPRASVRPGAAQRRGRRRDGARAARARRRRALLRRLPRGDRRQPAAAAPAAHARSRPTACSPTPRSVRRGGGHRPARGVAHRAAAARAPARRGRARRARRGGARRERRPAGRRGARRASTSGRWPARPAALARAEILRPEPPLGFVHPLVRDAVYHELAARRARARARARRRRCCATRARRPSRWRRTCSRCRAAARRGSSNAAVEAARAAARRERARERGGLPHRARSRSRRRPSGARRCCSSSASPRRITSGPAAVEHLREAYDAARRPARARARRRRAGPHAAVHGAAPTAAAAFAPRAAAELPARARRRAPGARGRRADAGLLRRRRARTLPSGSRDYRERPRSATGPARRCSPAAAAFELDAARPAAPSECVDAGAAARWRAATLLEARQRRSSGSAAMLALALADRPEALGRCGTRRWRTRTGSGSLFSQLSGDASGTAALKLAPRRARRGRGVAREQPRRRARAVGLGAGRRRPTRRASSAASLLERGDLARRAGRRCDGAPAPTATVATARTSSAPHDRRAAPGRGRRRGARSRRPRSSSGMRRARNPALDAAGAR